MSSLRLSAYLLPLIACGLLPEVPTPENRMTRVPSGAISVAVRSGSFWCRIVSLTVAPCTR